MTDHLESASGEAAPSHSRLNPLTVIVRRKWHVALGVVAGLVLGGLFYAQATPIYQSSAQVLVVKKTPDVLPAPGADARLSYNEDYLSTHQTLIRSPIIVGQAVRNANLGSLASFAGRGDPTGTIIDSLKVSRETNAGNPTTILTISYRSANRDDAVTVLDAVIDSYQKFLNTRYKNVTDETAKLIADASEILEKKLTRKQKEYDEFSLEHPSLWKGKDGVSLVQERVSNLEGKRSALIIQESEIKGQLEAFEKAVKEGKLSRPELIAMISRGASKSGGEGGGQGALALEERLITLETQEKGLLEDFGPQHPQVQAVRRQIGLLRTQMQRLGKATGADSAHDLDPVAAHAQSLKLDLENIQMTQKVLKALLEKEQGAAKVARRSEKQDEAYRLEIARSQQLFDAISKRVDEVSLIKNFAGGFEAETVAPARPGRKVYPNPVFVFTSAGILGFFAGLGIASLAELADQSFRTPEEIRRRLGVPLIGHVPFFDEKDAPVRANSDAPQLDPSLCSYNRPKSREAEAYRGVRTSLFFSAKASGRKVIQITSPDKGDGKSTLSTNLAISIAQADQKVLLIDADFRRPRLHKLFHLSGAAGLASVINGEAELYDAIQATPVPNLFVLPCGPIPANPAELLVLPQFHEILAVLREKYDFVIVDTPPLLAVTDPCIVVPHVDGVILTVRISKNVRPNALRAKEMLANLGATVLGVVVNGVGSEGYGYDSYRYGYTYKSYKYYANSNDSYYAEDDVQDAQEGQKPTPNSGDRPRKKKGALGWLFGR